MAVYKLVFKYRWNERMNQSALQRRIRKRGAFRRNQFRLHLQGGLKNCTAIIFTLMMLITINM